MSKSIRKRNKDNKIRRRMNNYGLTNPNNYSTFQKSRISFLDPHLYVTLKYKETFSSSVAAAAGSIQTMNINSLFDPNRTGTGHQPYGFDQIAALYNRYRVLKTKYKVTFGALAAVYHIVVVPVNGLLVSAISDQTTYQTACEAPFSASYMQSPNADSVTISRLISLNELNGVTMTEYLADDRFEAAVTASPTEIMTLAIGTFNPTGGSLVPYYDVELYFHVDFHDPISLTTS